MGIIVAIPMLIMGWHIYEFFSSEPMLVRLALAASFDSLVYVVFMLVKEPDVKQKNPIKWSVYIALSVMILFQAYVNISAYASNMSWPKAVISGLIFPVIAALLSFISMQRHDLEQQQKDKEQRIVKKRSTKPQKKTESSQSKMLPLESPTFSQHSIEYLAENYDWTDKLITRDVVEYAVRNSISHDRFKRCKNRGSLKRWWNEYEQQLKSALEEAA